jgi:hypothetical protein
MPTVKDNGKSGLSSTASGSAITAATTQPQAGEGAVAPPGADLDALAKIRAEWNAKNAQLEDDRKAVAARLVDLDNERQKIEADRQELMAREAQIAGLPTAAEMSPGEFRLYYLDDNGVLASSHYASIDDLINEMKVIRRDYHVAMAEAMAAENEV